MTIQLTDLIPTESTAEQPSRLPAEMLEAIQQAAHDAAIEAGNRAFVAAGNATRKIMADVETRLAQFETPRAKIMAVSIDAVTRPLTHAASKCLPDLIINAKLGLNTLLVGPAGCGKTFAVHQLAEALGRPYGHVCLTAGASETWLFGRQTPHGFIEGTFSKLYRTGGVFLADEMDAADANLLLSINTALANGSLFNPINGETYAKHADFVFVGAANTVGKGGDRVYTGRQRLDGSTLNRFACCLLAVDYDSDVERALCPDRDLYQALKHARAKLGELKSDEIISTRTFDHAFKLVAAGVDPLQVFKRITLGWPAELVKQAGLHEFERTEVQPAKAEGVLSREATKMAATEPDFPNTVAEKISANEARIAELKRKLAASANEPSEEIPF